MPNFHVDLKRVADSWFQPDTKHASSDLAAILMLPESPRTFHELADRTVTWIKDHKDEITKEDIPLLDSIKMIFSDRLSETDRRIVAIESIVREVKETYGFADVTRYVPNREALFALSLGREAEVDKLCHHLADGDWSAIMDAYKSNLSLLAIDAFRAFHDNRVTTEQFGTLLCLWSVKVQLPDADIRVNPLFDRLGLVDMQANQMLKISMLQKGRDARLPPSHMSDKEMTDFYNRMRQVPESERMFFSIEVDPKAIDLSTSNKTITQAIATTGISIFCHIQNGDKVERIIPSLSMMQQFLFTMAGEDQAVRIRPVIGLSTLEDIVRNGLEGTRDMALPFLGIDLPSVADQLRSPYAIDFINHDFYHSILASCIPDKYRKAFVEAADVVKSCGQDTDNPLLRIFFDECYERIVDMEHSFFRKGWDASLPVDHPTDDQKFLVSLVRSFAGAKLRLYRKTLNRRDSPIDIAYDVITRSYTLFRQRVSEQLADAFYRSGFFADHGIISDDIAPLVAIADKEMSDKKLLALIEASKAESIDIDGEMVPISRVADVISGKDRDNFFLCLIERMNQKAA